MQAIGSDDDMEAWKQDLMMIELGEQVLVFKNLTSRRSTLLRIQSRNILLGLTAALQINVVRLSDPALLIQRPPITVFAQCLKKVPSLLPENISLIIHNEAPTKSDCAKKTGTIHGSAD